MITPDFSIPRFLERAKTVTVTMPLYDGSNVLVPVASGTYNLYDGNGAVIFTGAVTIPTSGSLVGISTRDILATELPATLQLSDRWLEEWVLTLSDGSVETVRRDVYLCLRTMYPVVSERTFERRISDIAKMSPTGSTSLKDKIEETWGDVEARLIQSGKRPFLVTNAWALKAYHYALVKSAVFEDASTYMEDGGRYATLAKEAREDAKIAWSELQLEYDETQSGKRGSAVIASGPAVIFTNRPPGFSRTGWIS